MRAPTPSTQRPATIDRNEQSAAHQRQIALRRRAESTRSVEFFNILTGPELLQTTDALLPAHRERMYPPTVALSMFMGQVLHADGSCQQAVDAWAAQRAADGLGKSSVRTGAYCRARQRLPLALPSTLMRTTGRLLSEQAPPHWRWHGRAVKLVDGTTVSMPDTPENQACYPQPVTQAPGAGFPMARAVLVMCLATGAALDLAVGPHAGKGSGELALFRTLHDSLSPGDVVLADSLYCNYFLIATLIAAGIDVVFQQHVSRKTDFRLGRSLGPRDHIISWRKPAACPDWMTPEQHAAFPAEMSLREVRINSRGKRKGRVLVTTLRDHRAFDKQSLSGLYERRWHVELDLRNLKTTLGMDILSCRTPEMNQKQLWVHLLAYNVIRLMMAQAASNAGVLPRQLSFKHTVQLWIEWVARGLSADHDDGRLFLLIAEHRVGKRPGRVEPRKVKRRGKPRAVLTAPREQERKQIAAKFHGKRVK